MSTITLPNIRVSSDLTVKLKLKDGGVALDWSTLQNIKVSIYSDAQKAIAGRCDVSIDAEDPTVLVCTYAAAKPQYLGVQRLIVQARYMGRTKTYDKPAFTFVRWTALQAGPQVTIDDPTVDVEIVVEDVSSSIMDTVILAAVAAAERAEAAAEAAEHMVDIHTGPQGPAGVSPVVGENGNWFAWDDDAGEFVDTGKKAQGETGPQGIQGPQGETGPQGIQGPVGETPDISIGTVTTVEPGQPASASMGGTPEAPVLNLSIPKGAVGSTPNISVGTVTTGAPGTPVVIEITGTAEAPVLNITIPQGMKGDTGVSADYPITIYNGLDSSATDQALAAFQGKVLNEKVDQLEAKVTDIFSLGNVSGEKSIVDYEVAGATSLSSGYWAALHRKTLPDRNETGILKEIRFLSPVDSDTNFAIKLYKKVWTNGEITGFTAIQNGEYSFILPSGATSIEVLSYNIPIEGDVIIGINSSIAKYGNGDNYCIRNGNYYPSLQGRFSINVDFIVQFQYFDSERLLDIERENEDLKSEISASEKELGLKTVTHSEFSTGSSYTFDATSIATSNPSATSSNQGDDKYIPVVAGKIVEIKANSTNDALAIFLTVRTFGSAYSPATQGTMGNGCTTGFVIPAGTSKSFLIISDCYLHLMEGADLSFWPEYIQYRDAEGNIQKLFDSVFSLANEIGDLKRRPEVLENFADDTFPAVTTSGTNNPSFGSGTDFVKVDKDSLIVTNAYGLNNCADIAFYDENKTFMGYLGGAGYGNRRFGSYRVPANFQNAMFIRASFYQIQGEKFLFVLDAPTTKIERELYDDSVLIRNEYEFYGSSCVFSGNSISVENDGGRFLFKTEMPKEQEDYTPLLAIKMRCDSINGDESVDVLYNTHCYEDGVATGEVITMVVRYNATTYFQVSKISTWTLMGVSFVFVKNEFVDSLFTDKSVYPYNYKPRIAAGLTQEVEQWFWRNCYLMKNDIFDLERKQVVKGTPRAECSSFSEAVKNSNPFFYGKTYCCFGTSISAGSTPGGDVSQLPYCKYVGGYFGMKVKNLAKSGTTCYGTNGNIRTEILAMMPSDTMLVSMLNGANGWITSEDINSVDTSNAIGAYNVAIDYIREHYPKALIVIGADQSFDRYAVQAEKDLRRIAENKKVLLAETYHITNEPEQRLDGTHPTVDSKFRLAAGIVAAAENGILKTIIECDDYEKIDW